jgi:hypothetical protein
MSIIDYRRPRPFKCASQNGACLSITYMDGSVWRFGGVPPDTISRLESTYDAAVFLTNIMPQCDISCAR